MARMAVRGLRPISVTGTSSSSRHRRVAAGPISRLPPPWACCRGFTLLELLAVVVIIAVLLSFVRLSLGIAGPREDLGQAADRLAESLRLAADEAVLKGRRYGFSADSGNYGYLVVQGSGWRPLADDLLGPKELPAGITLSVRTGGRLQVLATPRDRPVLQFTPDGIEPAYEVELRSGDGDAVVIRDGNIVQGD